MSIRAIRHWVHKVLEVSEQKKDISWYVDFFLMSLISLNILAFILETVQPIYDLSPKFFYYFEVFSVIIFTVEYLLRLWTARLNKGFEEPFTGVIRYAITPLALIDLMAILPFYLPLIGMDLRFLRMLRLFRLFRLFKFARYMTAITVINNVIKRQKEQLILSLILLLFLLLFTSSLMYFLEHDVQPEAFPNIPGSMWWGVATITTVGYGDVYPITELGKALAGVVVLLGIGMIALPTGILVSGFMSYFEAERKAADPHRFCPHCGKELN